MMKIACVSVVMIALLVNVSPGRGEDIPSQPLKLNEIVLVGRSLGDSVQTVEVDEAAVKPTTLTEALEGQFFVEMQKAGEYSSEPYIRGRGIKGVPIFLEGMRLNAGHPDSTNLFNMIDVETVEVYRGPSAASLGMGAMSGAVVVKFREPEFASTGSPEFAGTLDARTSLFSTSGYSAILAARACNDLFNLSLSAGFDDYRNYDDGDGDEVRHSMYEASHYNAALSVKVSGDSYLYVRYMKDRADAEDPFSRYQGNGAWFYTDRPDDEGDTLFVGYKDAQLGGLDDVHLQVFGSNLHYDMNLKKEAPIDHVRELFRDTKTRGGQLSASKELGDHLLSLSAGYAQMKLTNGVRLYDASTGSWSPWVSAFGITDGKIGSYKLNLGDDLVYGKAFFNLSVGYELVRRKVHSNINSTALASLVPAELLAEVQPEDTNAWDHLVSVSATAGYEFSPAFVPYVKVSNAGRTPYFNEAYSNNPANGSLVPNQDLDNESVWGVDVGVDGSFRRLYYSGTFYYQEYDDYIELVQTGYQTTGGLPIKQYVNLDEATVYGVETLVGFALGHERFIEAAYLHTYGKNAMNDQPLAFIAPQKVTFTLAQRREKGLRWELEVELVDEQDRVSEVNGEVETPGYAVANIAVSYVFERLGWLKNPVLAFALNNIFDRDYRRHLDTVTSTAWYLPDEPGINGILSLHVEF